MNAATGNGDTLRYNHAIALFDSAIKLDSSKSQAYFYRGKCILRRDNISLSNVWDQINPPAGHEKDIPFLFHQAATDTRPFTTKVKSPLYPSPVMLIDSVFLERKRVYDPICKAIKDLEIISNHPEKMDGMVLREEYESDYLVEISVKLAIGFADLNNNGVLDFNSADSQSKEQAAFSTLCKSMVSLDSLKLDSLKSISKNPNDINPKIIELLSIVGKADTSFNNFSAQLRSGAQSNSSIDTNMASGLGDMISQLNNRLLFYFYNDLKDNNGNYYNTHKRYPYPNEKMGVSDSLMEPTLWIDFDEDSKIDINNPGVVPHLHIGDEIAMYPKGRNVRPVTSPLDSSGLDTSKYSLVKNSDTTLHFYRYKGPYTSEFIFGDFGIDEDLLDGKDNLHQGIVDADTRVVGDSIPMKPTPADSMPKILEKVYAAGVSPLAHFTFAERQSAIDSLVANHSVLQLYWIKKRGTK